MTFNDPGDSKKQKLGRGLSALLSEERVQFGRADRGRRPSQAPIGNLRPNQLQPRGRFDDVLLRELADSIAEKGILQPILVRPVPYEPDNYEIVAGERRWRAAQLARLHEVPIVVRELSDEESLELALIENIQRTDLNAMEEARGYARLIDQFDHVQEDVAKIVGKSRSHVANMLRLMALPESIQAMIEDGRLTAGHARALVTAHDPEAMAQQIISGNLSVRAAETLVAGGKPLKPLKSGARLRREDTKHPDNLAIERDISDALGLKVTIQDRGNNGCALVIAFFTNDEFEDLVKRLKRSPQSP